VVVALVLRDGILESRSYLAGLGAAGFLDGQEWNQFQAALTASPRQHELSARA
jgi:hypothetical protein